MAMTEKRLIDANALTDEIEKTDWYHINKLGELAIGANSELHTPLFKADDIFKALNQASTVDAVEVVRCKECKYRCTDSCPTWYMESWTYRDKWALDNDDDYCSYGERRTDG
jgi:hypothetical protein